jgi:hypothetical protein
VAFTKLYDRKTPITAADLLNDRVLPFFDVHEVKLCRVLTDRDTEYCGNPEPQLQAGKFANFSSVLCTPGQRTFGLAESTRNSSR